MADSVTNNTPNNATTAQVPTTSTSGGGTTGTATSSGGTATASGTGNQSTTPTGLGGGTATASGSGNQSTTSGSGGSSSGIGWKQVLAQAEAAAVAGHFQESRSTPGLDQVLGLNQATGDLLVSSLQLGDYVPDSGVPAPIGAADPISKESFLGFIFFIMKMFSGG